MPPKDGLPQAPTTLRIRQGIGRRGKRGVRGRGADCSFGQTGYDGMDDGIGLKDDSRNRC